MLHGHCRIVFECLVVFMRLEFDVQQIAQALLSAIILLTLGT